MSDIEDKIKEYAKKFAVKNAFDYGKARSEIVINKVFLELKIDNIDVDRVREIVEEVVNEINALPIETIRSMIKDYTFLEKKQREGLPDLEWVVKNITVNTRFAPNPSGFLHIGHAKIAILCDEYSKKYNGKFYVRFEDTDPKTKKPLLEAYNSIIDDLKWLGCSISGIFKQSERIDLYYAYAKKLIEMERAYVCLCSSDEMRKNREIGNACICRSADISTNLKRWEEMRTSYKEGEAVLRLKTDMLHSNPSVRDWIMFRIIESEHPIVGFKYRAWPLYNFASVIDDYKIGVNLVIRGNEHDINGIKQAYLYKALNLMPPHIMTVGIIRVTGSLAHKSDIIKAIQNGEITGWDDPRAPTVSGFRNKNISAMAIRKYVIDSGIGKNDSVLDMKKLIAESKKIQHN